MNFQFEVKPSSALFLDRDGVINKLLEGKYVKDWENEWEYIEGSLNAIVQFSKIFENIFVVTNQQGIGKKLMTAEELNTIHKNLTKDVNQAGGKITKIYHSPYLAKWNHKMRKPNTGMAEKAKEEFPEIVFKDSLMVGDFKTDMQFGKKLGMTCIYVGKDDKEAIFDYRFKNLEALFNAQKWK